MQTLFDKLYTIRVVSSVVSVLGVSNEAAQTALPVVHPACKDNVITDEIERVRVWRSTGVSLHALVFVPRGGAQILGR